jgi:hypothetical protein
MATFCGISRVFALAGLGAAAGYGLASVLQKSVEVFKKEQNLVNHLELLDSGLAAKTALDRAGNYRDSGIKSAILIWKAVLIAK